MTKFKKHKKFLVITTIFSLLVTSFGFMPNVKTAHAVDSIINARDLITDSDVSQTASHTFTFETTATTSVGEIWDIELPSGSFTGGATSSLVCPDTANFIEQFNAGAGPNGGDLFSCERENTVLAPTSTVVTIADLVNPATATYYTFNIYHYTASRAAMTERVQVMVYIIDDVLMTATIDSTLTFSILGVDAGTTVNTVNCSATTTATTTPFGTLAPGASTTVCQELRVGTNASDGFTVTVEQSDELRSSGNDTINSFDNSPDGTGSSTAHAWNPPTGVLNSYETYGHMGLTSQDINLSTGDEFGDALYKGFNSTDPIEVFYHTNPADGDMAGGNTEHIGSTKVAYTAEITSLQEAGDYETTLTYIVTPKY